MEGKLKQASVSQHRLTRNDYDRIRAARGARARVLLADDPDGCAGCGGELTNVTTGCKSCWDRLRRRTRREDPVKRAEDLRNWRNSYKRKRARRQERKAA